MNYEFIDPPPTMNIYAQKGSRVRFLNRNGHDGEAEEACEAGLNELAVYTVEKTEVGGWHTDVYLLEFPGKPFNSVLFEDYQDED